MSESEKRSFELVKAAKKIFHAAIESVSADHSLGLADEVLFSGPCHVVGAGKAAMAMAAALEHKYPECVFEGHVVVPHGYIDSFPKDQNSPRSIRVTEGGHPVPDDGSRQAATDALEIAHSCGEEDTLVVLLSGGASALWSLPPDGLTLEDLRTVNQLLLQSGAEIHEINTLRKHLSAIKGGWLAKAAWPAKLVTLAISDVIGDNPSVIGSGPTVADSTTWHDALEIIQAYDLQIPESVLNHLNHGVRGMIPDTPKPGSEQLKRSYFQLLASNTDALNAARKIAFEMGYHVADIDNAVHGEARDIGERVARKIRRSQPGQCLIWGGETTVTIKGNGKGGRNQELVLASAFELEGADADIVLLSAGTDGIDGPTDAAGGWVTSETIQAIRSQGIDPRVALDANDSYPCLKAVNQLLVTGPTHTNVMDIGITLIAHE